MLSVTKKTELAFFRFRSTLTNMRPVTQQRAKQQPEPTLTVDISQTKSRNKKFPRNYKLCTTESHAFHSRGFQKKIELAFFWQSWNFRLDTSQISDPRRPGRRAGCAHGWGLHRTNTSFLLPSLTVDRKLCEPAARLQIAILWLPWVPSRAQLANELLSNLHHATVEQHECSTAVDLVQCAMLNRWTSTLRLTVESATTRPGFRSAAKLLSRERSESCLVCALRKIRTCLWVSPFRVEFRRSRRWAIDERKQRWRRRRSRKG